MASPRRADARTHHVLLVAAALLGGVVIASAQQPTFRIQGKVTTASGAPVANARIQTDATAGVQGSSFVGDPRFSAKTNSNGEWGILGITRGTWVFEVSAAGFVPQAVVVPVRMTESERKPVTWRLPLRLISLDELRATPGDGAAVADKLAPLVADATMPSQKDLLQVASGARTMRLDGVALCAAGGLALLGRGVEAAREFYDRAEKMRPADPCGPLGVASTSLMLWDVDAAVAGYVRARNATEDQALKQVASAAIEDLQKIAIKTR